VYRYGLQKNVSNAAGAVDTSTSSSIIKTCTTATESGVGKAYNFYAYLYKLNDSSASSFVTSHGFGIDAFAGAGVRRNTHFGGGMLPQQSTVDGIRITTSTSVDLASFNIKLYGMKQ
jgi:hypothetical protein